MVGRGSLGLKSDQTRNLFPFVFFAIFCSILFPAFLTIGIAQQTYSPDVPGVFEGIQISIDVPLGYNRRDQLLQYMQSKFPGAKILIVHGGVSNPTVSEALVRHDATGESAKTESTAPIGDSESVLTKASDALSAFAKSTE
jgi:hypothetical protein